jgi:hypothetical protein
MALSACQVVTESIFTMFTMSPLCRIACLLRRPSLTLTDNSVQCTYFVWIGKQLTTIITNYTI